jgi:hypothetical protein
LRTVFGLSPVVFKSSPNGTLGLSIRASIIDKSVRESGARILRGLKARLEGLTPRFW